MKRIEVLDNIETKMSQINDITTRKKIEEENIRQAPIIQANKDKSILAAECERIITETGIVEIFQGICDRGIVNGKLLGPPMYKEVKKLFGGIKKVIDPNYKFAWVEIDKSAPMATLIFNDYFGGGDSSHSFITARVNVKGSLFVSGKEEYKIGELSVDQAVIKALTNPNFYSHEDMGW